MDLGRRLSAVAVPPACVAPARREARGRESRRSVAMSSPSQTIFFTFLPNLNPLSHDSCLPAATAVECTRS